MKQMLFFLGGAALFLSACASHYYKASGDSISFYLRNTDATDVHFQYSHDGYQCHEASRVAAGTWQVKVPSVNEFSYFYMVDGQVYIPPCRFTEKDDFGNENCIFTGGL